jgi:hypothetical protein
MWSWVDGVGYGNTLGTATHSQDRASWIGRNNRENVTVQGFTVQRFMVSLLVRDLSVKGLPRKLADTLEPILAGCIFPSL